MKLISDANPENEQPDVPLNDIVPEGENPIEVESEWALLEGGGAPKEKVDEDPIDEENDKVIIRRYEFYEYTGVYDEEHEPITLFLDPGDLLEPPAGELGKFLSANMVAAVLNVDPAPVVPGDLNGDGIVGSADLDTVRAHWGEVVAVGDLASGDADGDGQVGSGDLDTVRANWGTGAAAVPEPIAIVFFSIAGALLLTLRSRRGQ